MKSLVTNILAAIKPLGHRRPKPPVQRRARLEVENLEERALMSGNTLVLNGISPLASFTLQQGNLYQSISGGPKTLIDTQVKSFATGVFGNTRYLFDLNANAWLKSTTGGAWANQDFQIQSFKFEMLAGTEFIIDLNATGVLKSSSGSGWGQIDTGVISFDVGTLMGTNYLFDLNSPACSRNRPATAGPPRIMASPRSVSARS